MSDNVYFVANSGGTMRMVMSDGTYVHFDNGIAVVSAADTKVLEELRGDIAKNGRSYTSPIHEAQGEELDRVIKATTYDLDLGDTAIVGQVTDNLIKQLQDAGVEIPQDMLDKLAGDQVGKKTTQFVTGMQNAVEANAALSPTTAFNVQPSDLQNEHKADTMLVGLKKK